MTAKNPQTLEIRQYNAYQGWWHLPNHDRQNLKTFESSIGLHEFSYFCKTRRALSILPTSVFEKYCHNNSQDAFKYSLLFYSYFLIFGCGYRILLLLGISHYKTVKLGGGGIILKTLCNSILQKQLFMFFNHSHLVHFRKLY